MEGMREGRGEAQIGASAEQLGGGRKWDGSGVEGGRRERAMVVGVRSFSYSCSAGRALQEDGGRNPQLAERGRADMKGEDDGAETGSLSKGGQRGETRGGEEEEEEEGEEPGGGDI